MSFTQTIKIQDELVPPEGNGQYVIVYMMGADEDITEQIASIQFAIEDYHVDIDIAFRLLMNFFDGMDAWSDRYMPPQDMTFVFEEINPNDSCQE